MRLRTAVSTTCTDSARSPSATARKRSRSSSTPPGRGSARISWRVKKRPDSSSEWYAASTIQPPISARKDVMAAMMPVSSGQASVRT
jgi:hypothetical protein